MKCKFCNSIATNETLDSNWTIKNPAIIEMCNECYKHHQEKDIDYLINKIKQRYGW